ncbi:MAG TPA: hypothetical protein VFG51_01090 [Candidatus Saccharimonadia bacterium]|nr:hypothetical protein [Candidatus Saccharimonadia bacterium]
MNDLLGLAFDTDFSQSVADKPKFVEFEPITVDGITFTLINGTWHAYLSPERLNDALAHPDQRITPTEIVTAAIKAGKVPIANGATCVITLQGEKGFLHDAQGYYLDPNELQTIIPLPAKECIAVTVAETQQTIDILSPTVWGPMCGSIVVTGVLGVWLISRRLQAVKKRHDAHAANSRVDIGADFGLGEEPEDPKLKEAWLKRIAHEERRREVMNEIGSKSEQELWDMGLNHDYTARDKNDEGAWARILKEKDDARARKEIVTTVTPGKFQETWRKLFGGK